MNIQDSSSSSKSSVKLILLKTIVVKILLEIVVVKLIVAKGRPTGQPK